MNEQILAFFAEPHSLLGDSPRRPRSLMSQAALDLLGITAHLPSHALDLDEEATQIAVYDYIHAAPIADVKMLVARVNWRTCGIFTPVQDETVALFRAMRDEYHAIISACEYRIRLKEEEKEAADKQPADLHFPALLAIRLRRIAEETSWSRDFILWELSLPEALQMLHASQLAANRWTIAPTGNEEATPEDLTPHFLLASVGIDTPSEA